MGGRVITITSGKGGVGKTTTTANLSAAVANMGKRVVCIDADIGLRNLDLIMGLEQRIRKDLVDLVERNAPLEEVLIQHRLQPNLFLIPASQSRDKSAVSPQQMITLCNQLREQFEMIFVDCPAGIERGFRNAVAPADEVIIVTNPEVSAVRDADRVIGILQAEKRKLPIRLVLNRVRPEMVRRGEMLSPDDIVDILGKEIRMIGVVPEDENIIIAGNRGAPNADSKAGQAYRDIARRLNGEDVPINMDNKPGLFNRIAKLFGN